MLRQVIGIAGEELKFGLASSWYRVTHGRQQAKQSVLVNGSPKTGTTWMLKLISSLPGYQIAAKYNFNGNIELYREVQPGQVVHGHDPFTADLWANLHARNIRVILMVRDPRDQAVSRMFHIKRDTTHRQHRTMKAMSDDQALMACLEGMPDVPGVETMLALTRSWLKQGDKAFCVKYEDLRLQPVAQFRQVLQYLGIKANDDLTRAIVERNRFERLSIGRQIWKTARKPGQSDPVSHYRKGIVGDWRNYFNDSHIGRFKEIAGDTLIDLGYETDYDW